MDRGLGRDRAAARAALAVCESLLIGLLEAGVFGREEARGLLEDAAAAQNGPDPVSADAVKAIERLIAAVGSAEAPLGSAHRKRTNASTS
ncbi:MAG TPA: hypothetical protein VEY95_06415 [Azospirillaceae bacterium]|nr:hypothetical protein [Azospirillaceae bacterium]